MSQAAKPGSNGASPSRAVWLLVALTLAASLVHAAWPGVLDYDRAAIVAGQWWRLLSAHVVHLNAAHAAMNLIALALVIALLRDACSAVTWFLVYAALALAVSVGLFLFDPQLARYAGASGVIHGLVAFGALLRLGANRIESGILLAGLAGKLVVEATGGAVASSEALIGAPVITASHRYGAVAGAAIALAILAWRRFSAPEQL